MKLLKYLAILLIVLAIVAAVVTYQRESIIRDLANSVLREYGLTVGDLSIDTLATDHVILSRLVLRQDDGTRYEMTNVSFPLSFPSFRTEKIAIGELLMVPAQPSDEPPQLSGMLRTFLELPQSLPNTTVTLSRFSTIDVPPLSNIVWRSESSRGVLTFDIDTITVHMNIEPSGDGQYRATVSAAVDRGGDTLATQLDIRRQDSGFGVEGTAHIGLVPWLPLLHALDVMPAELIALDADLDGPVSLYVDDDAALPMRLDAKFAIAGRRSAAYRVSADKIVQVTAAEAAPVALSLEYPSMEWNATSSQSDLAIRVRGIGDARGRLSNLSCHSGIRCTMHVAFDSETLQAGSASVTKASFASTITATVDEKSLFEFAPDLSFSFGKLASEDILATKIKAAVTGGARVVVENDGWTAEVRKLNLNTAALADSDISVGGASFAATLNISSGDDIRIAVASNSSLTLNKLASGNQSATSISASGIQGARLQIGAGGWQGDVEKLRVNLDGISNGDGLVATLPLSLDKIRLRESAANIRMAYSMPPKAASISWNDASIVAPGISGTVTLRDATLSTTLELSSDKNAVMARINALHHLNTGQGSMALTDAALHFDRQKLSAWTTKWPYPWDLVAGSCSASADVNWDAAPEGVRTRGTIVLRADGLAGFYTDIAFTGLNTRLSTTLDPEKGVAVIPATMTVALLDVGISIQEIAADFAVDIPGQLLSVRTLTMATLGGTLLADPFDYSLLKPANNIMLRPQSVQLQFMLDLAEFEDVQLSGSISGRIPVSISERGITVTGGRLESDAPGVIRYQAGVAIAAAGKSEIGLVSRALNNFQYDSLTSDVNYTEAGDLKLKMRLSGINPDMDARQPVILNLGVENNIPQLLRSLRATRAIEDVLQRKGKK